MLASLVEESCGMNHADIFSSITSGVAPPQVLQAATGTPPPPILELAPPPVRDIQWDPTDKKGDPKPGFSNAQNFLESEFDGKSVWFNVLNQMIEVESLPINEKTIGEYLIRLERVSGKTGWKREHIEIALSAISEKRPKYDPIVEYLRKATWDGVPRISTLVGEVLKVEEASQIHTRYLECFLIGAVSRAINPGSKVDTALILQGPQGAGKSTFFRQLVPDEKWFADDIPDISNKDSALYLRTSWIVEWSELSSIQRASSEFVKGFLSRTKDKFRPPYAREMVEQPRRAVICGSTNNDEFLMDSTGNRRFMVIPVQAVDKAKLIELRDQIWAEALSLYEKKTAWWLTDAEQQQQATENEAHASHDPWEAMVAEWLKRAKLQTGPLGGWQVSCDEILLDCINLEVEKWTLSIKNRIYCQRTPKVIRFRTPLEGPK
jgi:hypothetical protein